MLVLILRKELNADRLPQAQNRTLDTPNTKQAGREGLAAATRWDSAPRVAVSVQHLTASRVADTLGSWQIHKE
jgi:hypothetical protein